jgi:hypothetical protein
MNRENHSFWLPMNFVKERNMNQLNTKESMDKRIFNHFTHVEPFVVSAVNEKESPV